MGEEEPLPKEEVGLAGAQEGDEEETLDAEETGPTEFEAPPPLAPRTVSLRSRVPRRA